MEASARARSLTENRHDMQCRDGTRVSNHVYSYEQGALAGEGELGGFASASRMAGVVLPSSGVAEDSGQAVERRMVSKLTVEAAAGCALLMSPRDSGFKHPQLRTRPHRPPNLNAQSHKTEQIGVRKLGETIRGYSRVLNYSNSGPQSNRNVNALERNIEKSIN